MCDVRLRQVREFYARQQRRIDERKRHSFTAAQAFGRILAPDDDSLASDLWLHWHSAEHFARRYPWWYKERWQMDIVVDDIDWYVEDCNVWGYLQDCLGVRRLLVALPEGATPDDILAALDASHVKLPRPERRWTWVTTEERDAGIPAFLRMAADWIQEHSDQMLVRLNHFWSEDLILTTLPSARIDECFALAREADFVRDEDPPFVVL